MAIASQTLETLEYPAILAQLARHTAFALSRELALALTPSHDVVEIRRRLRLTREARRLLDDHNDATIGGARDIRGALGRARLGGSLDAPVFLDIAATLSSGRRLRGIILRGDPLTYPALRELAGELPVLHLHAKHGRARQEQTETSTPTTESGCRTAGLDLRDPWIGQALRIGFSHSQKVCLSAECGV